MRSQPAAALPVLALGADEAAKYERRKQAYKRVQEVRKRKGMQEGH
jgi:hypothetical protein